MTVLIEQADRSTTRTGNRGRVPGSGLSTSDFVGAVLALVAFVVGSRVIVDNSFLTHLATGRLIVTDGAVPSSDPYSYLASGEPWTVQSWLPSALYYLINDSVGGWGIRLFNGALTSSLMYHLWKLLAPTRQLVLRVVLAGSCLIVGAYLWTPRPLLFGLLAMVLLIRVADRQLPLATMLPIMYLWVNSHGSFPLAGVYIVALLLGGWADRRRFDPETVRLLVVTAFSIAVAAVNPVGWRLLWFPVHLLRRREALESVVEWAAPTFTSAYEWVFLALVGLLFVATRRGAPIKALLPAFVFSLTALLAVRNIGFASIVTAASIAPFLRSLVGSADGQEKVRVAAVGVGAVGVCLVLATFNLVRSPPVSLDRYPVAEVQWLEERSLVAEGDIRIVQRESVGNYLTYKYGAEARVFVDDRFDFYPQDVLDDHIDLVVGGNFQEIVERRGFDVAIWERDLPFAFWLEASEDWEVALSTDNWIVACRKESTAQARCL